MIWRALFGGRGKDYEKRLQHLSKEEAAVHVHMRRRVQFARRSFRNLVVLSILSKTKQASNGSISHMSWRRVDLGGPTSWHISFSSFACIPELTDELPFKLISDLINYYLCLDGLVSSRKQRKQGPASSWRRADLGGPLLLPLPAASS
ncbi:hypothetical protein E2562_025218 [Oryza meyeriana var. granulata]|uniref:Uncharacterized protein n=1 Tax=Oryza meyeriana var. granulata TaxID=110450 RepID=A0A6G1BZV6_9ORYZ|nr:hypothetical protein E2562_025218 [Oryza meyeriana var. granulata]